MLLPYEKELQSVFFSKTMKTSAKLCIGKLKIQIVIHCYIEVLCRGVNEHKDNQTVPVICCMEVSVI
jgi:hypothetical protein